MATGLSFISLVACVASSSFVDFSIFHLTTQTGAFKWTLEELIGSVACAPIATLWCHCVVPVSFCSNRTLIANISRWIEAVCPLTTYKSFPCYQHLSADALPQGDIDMYTNYVSIITNEQWAKYYNLNCSSRFCYYLKVVKPKNSLFSNYLRLSRYNCRVSIKRYNLSNGCELCGNKIIIMVIYTYSQFISYGLSRCIY